MLTPKTKFFLSHLGNRLEWYFPFIKYDPLINKLQAITKLNVLMKQIPAKISQILNAFPPIDVTNESKVEWKRLPQALVDSLKPFQRQGIKYV